MNHHQQFRKHLDTLPDGEKLLSVCRKYKAAPDGYAFDLNGRLKGGVTLDPYSDDFTHLQRLICAILRRPITLYRVTSVASFSASVTEVLSGSFQYRAFMSTASEQVRLPAFLPPKSEQGLLLEIECPPGTAFAPIDLFPGTDENEYLLGCGTRFTLSNGIQMAGRPGVNEPSSILALNSLPLLQLKVTANPPYVKAENLVPLSD
jgi:hypothetical protein